MNRGGKLRAEWPACECATLSDMEIGVREVRNRTGHVLDAVRAGERVTLTVHGEPVADIVAHAPRSRWLPGAQLREQLQTRAADAGLTSELDELAGQTLRPHASAGPQGLTARGSGEVVTAAAVEILSPSTRATDVRSNGR